MLPVVLAAFVLMAIMGGVAFLTIRTTLKAKKDEETAAQPQRAQAAAAPRQAAPAGGRQAAFDRMRANMRQRLAARQAEEAGPRAAEAVAEGSDDGSEDWDGSDDEGEGGVAGDRRAARRAARGEAAAAQRAAQEAKPSKRSAYEERRAKREAELEAQEAAQEEEIRRAAEERARREEEEAAKWMGQIVLEEQGEEGDESGAAQEGLLAQFVEAIRSRKTVPLEALALEFGMRTTDVIDRIRALEAAGRLTGVMDERGKYIYISLDEMNAVASYVRSRGRVAISELAARSASLIDLESRSDPAAAGPGSGGAAAAGGAAVGLDFDQLLAAA